MTPISLAWTLRWYANDVMKKYPGVFNLPDPNEPFTESFLDIVGVAMALYALWWIIYTFGYMFFFGRYLGAPWSTYDTLYFWAVQEVPAFGKAIGFDGSTPESRVRFLPIIKFGLFHASYVITVISISYLLWFSFWFHSTFAMLLFFHCASNGSIRYYDMITANHTD